jgi:hypothetical protein
MKHSLVFTAKDNIYYIPVNTTVFPAGGAAA